jgi:hypothetical protein
MHLPYLISLTCMDLDNLYSQLQIHLVNYLALLLLPDSCDNPL